MPLWIRKIFVIFIAIVTLGTVIPTNYLYSETEKSKADYINSNEGQDLSEGLSLNDDEISLPDLDSDQNKDTSIFTPWSEIASALTDYNELAPTFVDFAVREAEVQGIQKFGTYIADQVGDQYLDTILPQIELVMNNLTDEMDEEMLRHVIVSTKPAGGTGEKILHFYDGRSGRDIFRFHVRRDHPPQDGYWFNFHYHKASDNFESHHDLGKIYWDKNTPPNWMA
ncbi:YpjP family protein [Pseudalkalibacillus caeni]|uniref:Cell division protein FtsK n=1 Tax=Exobacillus caeni TaxID=2574798 RepID=A0A5R9FAG4_9BACL|nr:YpjP family protein [Pseudalkalibacillus caeni]TLS37544.1 hypothetical protein FCL54_10410 [Pseudalkalibacillus caeni]